MIDLQGKRWMLYVNSDDTLAFNLGRIHILFIAVEMTVETIH